MTPDNDTPEQQSEQEGPFAPRAAWGGGKYEAVVNTAMEMSLGDLVLVVVINGVRGSGFSVACHDPAQLPHLAAILRSTADSLDATQGAIPSGPPPEHAHHYVREDRHL